MQLSVLPTCLFLVLFLVMFRINCQAREQHKQGKPLLHLCGENFMEVWRTCCDHQCKVQSYKRALGITMPVQKANGFLEPASKRSNVRKRRTIGINAVEECCLEGCSTEEINEYVC